MTTAPNLVESLLSTSEIETLCALNGVKARKAACMLANPRNLYAIQATERARGNRVILLEAVAGRLRALGLPAEAPIVTRMLAFERPEFRPVTEAVEYTSERPCPKCKRTETTGAVFGYRKMKHTVKSGEVRIVTRRQSRCSKCRGGYVKAKPGTEA